MNLWHILEIDPTHDLATIKKAYAKKLKRHHPEEDPEGYQRLREAYDTAVKLVKLHAKRQTTGTAEAEEPSTEDPASGEAASGEAASGEAPWPQAVQETVRPARPVPNKPTLNEQLDHLVEKANSLYSDFRSRMDITRWTELLNADVMWNIKHKRLVGERLYLFAQEHRMLPRGVWLLFESSFHWKAEADELEQDEFMTFYLRQLNGPELRFAYLDPELDIQDIDRFLSRREAACWSLQKNDLEQASQAIDEALYIFGEDPDLLRLQGELYVRIGNPDEALEVFAHVVRLLPAEPDGYVNRARILHRLGRFPEAIPECEKVLVLAPHHKEARQILGRSLIGTADTGKALVIFEQLHASYPDDSQFMSILAELQPAMLEERYHANPRTRRRLSRFALSPSRLYRLKRRRNSILIAFMALVLIGNIYYFSVHNYQPIPIVISSPEKLLEESRLGEYVQVTLEDTQPTAFFEEKGTVLDSSVLYGINPTLLTLDQVVVGYVGDYLVAANQPEERADLAPGESIPITGTLRPITWLKDGIITEDKLAEQFGASKVAPIYIDSAIPPSDLTRSARVFRIPLTIYLIWYIVKRLSRRSSR